MTTPKGPHWAVYAIGLLVFIGIFGCGQVWRVPDSVIDMLAGGSPGHYHELEILWNDGLMSPDEYSDHLGAVATLVAKGDDDLLKSFISLGLHCDGDRTLAYEAALGDMLPAVTDERLADALTGFRSEARTVFRDHLLAVLKRSPDAHRWPRTLEQLSQS